MCLLMEEHNTYQVSPCLKKKKEKPLDHGIIEVLDQILFCCRKRSLFIVEQLTASLVNLYLLGTNSTSPLLTTKNVFRGYQMSLGVQAHPWSRAVC